MKLKHTAFNWLKNRVSHDCQPIKKNKIDLLCWPYFTRFASFRPAPQQVQQDCSVINNNSLFLYVVLPTSIGTSSFLTHSSSEGRGHRNWSIKIKIKKCDTPSSFCEPLRTNFTGRQAHYSGDKRSRRVPTHR